MPLSRAASGLHAPVMAATAAGAPKMPAPMTPFTTPAVRSKRPMARTKPGREDVAGSTRDSTRREGSR